MTRDARYGAFLALALLFFCFFMFKGEPFSPFRPHETAPRSASSAHPSVDIRGLIPGLPVNINTATVDELAMLPGVGDVTAERIIAARRSLGGFTSVDQLTEVKWIGKVKLDKIRRLVTVD